MTSQSSRLPATRFRLGWIMAGVLLVTGALAAFWWPMIINATARLSAADPVTAAWEKAQASGSYHFSSDVTQTTQPIANAANVGRSGHTDQLYLEGQNDLQQRKMELTLWAQGGNVAQPDSGLAIKVENGKTFARQGMGNWKEMDDLTSQIAPDGDFLAYLVAMHDVTAHESAVRYGVTYTRYSFRIDGPTLALYMRDQMEAVQRAKGELPLNAHLDVPTVYRDMTGEGEIWINAAGLPIRQTLDLHFPEQNGEVIEAQIAVNFSQYAQPTSNLLALLQQGDMRTALQTLASQLPNSYPLLMLLSLTTLAALMIRYRSHRQLQTVTTLSVIVSMLVGPLLSTFLTVGILDRRAAKAATQEQQKQEQQSVQEVVTQEGAPGYDPRQNPLTSETVEQSNIGTVDAATTSQSLNLPVSAAAVAADVDSDQDGLSDFVELRVGTDPTYSDSDEDGVSDKDEVLGSAGWFGNPNDIDSNRDGLADGLEWDVDGNGQLDDTDGDGLPNAFDPDNDNDGVPDRMDGSPFSAATASSTAGFDKNNPFQLTIKNLEVNMPTFVDFQIRPQDKKQLWYAFNVLDWPHDSEAQIQDIDDKTYKDIGGNGLGDDLGDMKLVPMLEIRMPAASANLPSKSDLSIYNISVNDYLADKSVLVAYLPLNVVNEPQTGERVAFSGHMRYLPTGTWSAPHEIRLVWLVQVLTDQPCDAADAKQVALGCASDGYIHNVGQVVQSYYEPFTVTGLNVREDHGEKTAIIYEDPATDSNKKDDTNLVSLAHGLENSFLAGRDQDGNKVRDVDLNEIVRRFDRDGNSGVSLTQRWNIPANAFQVESKQYATSDEAIMTTAMTETKRVLNSAFTSSWQSDKTIKPLLMYAREESYRSLGLDALRTPGNYVSQSGSTYTFDMLPASQPKVTLDVSTSLKWTPYCAPNASSPLWDSCAPDSYWTDLETRYGFNSGQPGDPNDPEIFMGRLAVMQLYFAALMNGVNRIVQNDNTLVSSRYTLQSDSATETTVRSAVGGGAAAVQALTNIFVMARYVDKLSVLKFLGRKFLEFRGGEVGKGLTRAAQVAKGLVYLSFNGGGALIRTLGTAVVLSVAGVLTGLVTGLYFFADSFMSDNPQKSLVGKATLRAVLLAVTFYLSVYAPIMQAKEWANMLKLAGSSVKIWSASARVLETSFRANLVGSVLSVAATWGFFVYSMVSNHYSLYSVAFNKGLLESIVTTFYLILLLVLSYSLVGTILVGILTFIDAVLTAVCELGVTDLRKIKGLDGACFTLSTAAIKSIAGLVYNNELLVDLSRSDLMVTGAPKVLLGNPAAGLINGNPYTVTVPVTTTVEHKHPEDDTLLQFPNLYSFDILKTSYFQYNLTTTDTPPPTRSTDALGVVDDRWQETKRSIDLISGATYYQAQLAEAVSTTGQSLKTGLNTKLNLTLGLSFWVPAADCWSFIGLFPKCNLTAASGATTSALDAISFDVFPTTLAQFLTLEGKTTGGVGLAWDPRFTAIKDIDGDGLLSSAYNGLDPNDTTWDSDNDGLSDRYELDQRISGDAYSPITRDTDNDGLTDLQEAQLGSDPGVADSDNDGLLDGEEVRYQVLDANNNPTATWRGGWQIEINNGSGLKVWVSSDPFNADSDFDSISDLAEKQLAQSSDPAARVDSNGVPYNPRVANAKPLALYVQSNAVDGYVSPSYALVYTTTAIASVPLEQGTLQVTAAPNQPVLTPQLMAFSPLTSTAVQTVTQVTNFILQPGPQTVDVTSTVRARLQSGTSDWVIDPVAKGAPLAGFAAPFSARNTALLAPRLDRGDRYWLGAMTSDGPFMNGVSGSNGEIRNYDLSSGVQATLEASGTSWKRVKQELSYATNNYGTTLVVWDHGDKSGNISSWRVAGTVLDSAGKVLRTISVLLPPPYNNGLQIKPVVASNGDGFLVAFNLYSDETSPGFNTVKIGTYGFNKDGMPDRFTIHALGTTDTNSEVNLDLTGIDNSNYRLVWKQDKSTTVWTSHLKLDGSKLTPGTPGWIALVNDATASNAGAVDKTPYTPKLAFDPKSGRWILVYSRGTSATGVVNLYPSSSSTTLLATRNNGGGSKQNFAAYVPATGGWLAGWYATTQSVYMAFKSDLTDLSTQAVQNPPVLDGLLDTRGNNGISALPGAALACPATTSNVALDLRFEEVPGATSFADASLNTKNATCSGTACPAAGVAGAPNAPASDYALQFDGANDRLNVSTAFDSNFSVAFWVKLKPITNTQPIVIIDQGIDRSGGWGISLDFGRPTLTVFGRALIASKNVDDNQWHLIVATRDQGTRTSGIYIDGTAITFAASDPSPLTAFKDLVIGGDRAGSRNFNGQLDHLQIYPSAMAADTVKDLYNRSLQSYCVVSGPGANGANIQWGTINLRRSDARGGLLEASNGLKVVIDNKAPTASITSATNQQILLPNSIIGGVANDVGAGVARVEVQINGGAWQLANGLETWTYSLAGLNGDVDVQVRGVDAVGNVGDGAPSKIRLRIDGTGPDVTIRPLPDTIKPTKNANGRWEVLIRGQVSDLQAGVNENSMRILLQQQNNLGVTQEEQTFTPNVPEWGIYYQLNPSLYDPTGVYSITVQAADRLGNRSTVIKSQVRLDASGPDAFLSANDAARSAISQTLTMGGVVTDSNSIVGVDKVEIAFTPIEQVLALPKGTSSDAAEALLNRPWNLVTLAQAGQPSSSWSYPLPNTLEGIYQIDLRATDKLGNVRINSNVWRGTIDTRAPRVAMTGSATGNTQLDPATNTQRYEIRYTCRADDWQLQESSFNCPGNAIQPASRAFNNSQILQTNFPSLTLLIAMSNTWTIWSPSNVPTGTTSVCDVLGLCSSVAVVNGNIAASNALVSAANAMTDAPSALPKANILNPTYDSFVGSTGNVETGNVEVTVGAEAAQGLREVTIFADDEVVATIPFARIDKVTVAQESLSLALSPGKHELKAVASDWLGNQQNDASAIRFTVVSKEPTITLGKSNLTLSDTWAAQSGMVILRGTVDDSSENLAVVQVKVGDQAYMDALVKDGTWGVAYPAIDPENRNLPISVRAIDKAGQISKIGEQATANFGTGDTPETTIVLAPDANSTETSAVFSFTGTFSGTIISAFKCQIDNGSFSVCSSPKRYNDLSNGEHSFRVHAINGAGIQDPTPAEFKWIVKGQGERVEIESSPTVTTTSRSALFEFEAASENENEQLECSLDDNTFSACTSPQSYISLEDGNHTFRVRVKGNPASKVTWRVINVAPVATDMTLTTLQNVNLPVTLVAKDESTLKYIVVGKPANGTLNGEAPNLVYQPATDFFGTDSFSFKADDGDATSNLATVIVNVTPTPGQDGLQRDNFVVFGQEGVILREAVKVMSGDIAASLSSQGPWLGDGAEVSIGEKVTFADATSKVMGDTLFLGEKAVVGNVNYNELRGPGKVSGTKVTPQALPLLNRFVSLPAIGVGKQDITVASAGSATVAPGNYQSLKVGERGEVTFTGGVYSFKEWNVGEKSKLYFAGATEIRISGQALVGEYGYVGPAPSSAVTAKQIVIYVAGVNASIGNLGGLGAKAATFGPYATLAANVVVPNGTLLIRERSKAVGSFVGRWVSVGKFSELTLANRFSSSMIDGRVDSFINLTLDDATGLNATASLSADVDAELLSEEGSNEEVPTSNQPSKIYLPVISIGSVGQSTSQAVESAPFAVAPEDEDARNMIYLPNISR